jgi:ABC-2 type transport system permease protein
MTRLRILGGYVQRDWRVAISYRFAFLFDMLALLASLAMYFFIGKFASGGEDFFAFALAGLLVFRLQVALARTALAIEAEIASGMLEETLAYPVGPWLHVMGSAAFELLRALAYAAAMLGCAVALFGAPGGGAVGLLAAGAGLVGAALLFFGLVAATVGIVLVIRQGSALSSLIAIAAPILSGAYFPLSALPAGLEEVARATPFRFPVDVIRIGLLDGRIAWGQAGLMAATATAMSVLGLLVLAGGTRYARRVGGLSRP